MKPGIIGKLATEDEPAKMSSAEKKIFTAAAYAHLETKIPILTHCWAGWLGLEQIDVLTQNGVPPEKIIIGHLAVQKGTLDRVLKIADKGVYIGIDTILDIITKNSLSK